MNALPLTSAAEAARYRAEGLWHDRTLYECFAASAARCPDKPALIEAERQFSYAQLRRTIDDVAGNLLDLGLDPGDVVALQAGNRAEMPIVHLACNRIGLLYMPLHDSWRETEIRHLLQRSRARVFIAPVQYRGFDHAAMINGLRGDLPDLRHVLTLDGLAPECQPFEQLLRPTRHAAASIDARRPDPDIPAHTMLSGGTTALSKISRFSCNDLIAMLDNFARAAELTEHDIAAGIAPAGTGATGYVFPILTPLLHGATAVILERWGDPAEAVDLIVRHRCTYAVGIPAQLTLMVPALERRAATDFAHFRLFLNAGAPMPADTGLKIETLMGCVSQSMYGATDGGVPTATSVRDPQDKRLATVGRVFPGFECELRDPNGRPVPAGHSGEIVWRAPDKSWGYLGDDEQTAATFTPDRFYRSGDLGEFDADGYLRIVGRVKDMILRGGRNISPLTIEQALIRHPAVLDVSVAAIPDKVLGERACAFVLLRDGASLTLPDAVDFLKQQQLAVWQLPERLEIVAELPRGPGGKILKSRLTAMVVEKMKAGEPRV